MRQTYECLDKFFRVPLSDKMASHVSKHEGLRGYSAMYEQGGYGLDITDSRVQGNVTVAEDTEVGDSELMDAKEVFHIGQELDKSHPHYNSTLFAPNVWPAQPAEFEVRVHTILLRDSPPRVPPLYLHSRSFSLTLALILTPLFISLTHCPLLIHPFTRTLCLFVRTM
eukprot:GFYU01068444.1.p1 GENE.GFYU01068444.1~~GFYU01068444.1.p1  ORF type:complete len:168 (+),score=30.25 GFYU01068444.1:226-729(+)